jgi:hypothetical protein
LRSHNTADPNNKWQRFWDTRISSIMQAEEPEEFILELKEFGHWFDSGIFDDKWALNHLRTVLQITDGRVAGGAYIVKRLSKLPSQFIADTLECAILLGRGSEDQLLYYSKEYMAKVYAAAKISGSDETKKKAEQLRSILLSKNIDCAVNYESN